MTHENKVKLDFEVDEELGVELRKEWHRNDLSWDKFIKTLLKLGLEAEKAEKS